MQYHTSRLRLPPSSRGAALTGAIFTGSLMLAACGLPLHAAGAVPAAVSSGDRPNVLLIVSDDQRPDTIHALGNSVIRTPHLDRLVQEGTAFVRATCANPICTPSRAELLTGCTGFRNGVFDFGRQIAATAPLWARTMADAGYRCGFVGKWHNDGVPTSRGFEATRGLFRGGGGNWAVNTFDWNGKPVSGYRGWIFQTDERAMLPLQGVGLSPNISQVFAGAAIELIGRPDARPFFVTVCFTAPHDPLLMPFGYEDAYDPEDMPVPDNFLPRHPFDHGNFEGRDEQLFNWPRTPEEVRRELAVYYAVISHMDAQIGRMLQKLDETGQAKNTLVIFCSDHGLAIGSHGLRGKQNMYEHTIGVPLVLRGPGVPAGERKSAQCYLRDLFPTCCDLAGIKSPPSVQGRSLKPVLDGTAESIYPFVVGYFRDSQRMLRTDDWKLIVYPQAGRTQLFDLTHDPLERHDLSEDPRHPPIRKRLYEQLREWQAEAGDPLVLEDLN